MLLNLGAPHSAIRRAFVEEGPWQSCPLCGEQSGSWEWLEEHILRCAGEDFGAEARGWGARWCPACGGQMGDGHDPDTCVEERIAT